MSHGHKQHAQNLMKFGCAYKGLRERLGLDEIISVLQRNRLGRYGHVLQKEDNDWVKKCMEYEVQGAQPRGRPKKTWRLWKKTVRHVN